MSCKSASHAAGVLREAIGTVNAPVVWQALAAATCFQAVSACFADLGIRVVALDVDERRIENLNKGILPIYEPGLEELVKRNVKAGRLSFTTSYADALKGAEFAFIAVGTPSGVDGAADLQYVEIGRAHV